MDDQWLTPIVMWMDDACRLGVLLRFPSASILEEEEQSCVFRLVAASSDERPTVRADGMIRGDR